MVSITFKVFAILSVAGAVLSIIANSSTDAKIVLAASCVGSAAIFAFLAYVLDMLMDIRYAVTRNDD